MRLVAGTYPRREGMVTAQALQQDQKELAEHYMLVDHCRNDIGKVAKIGSVKVSDLASVEPYRDVYHLVSQVNGILSNGQSIFDACRACFPIATLTGTPKIRAMEIIAELESMPRGYFGGISFMAGSNGFLDSAVIIRSALVQENCIEIRAGAGIVDDSSPEREFLECIWKSQAMSESIHACEPSAKLTKERAGQPQ
jgi:anthranilate/para-aminobenzoate synthase component I